MWKHSLQDLVGDDKERILRRHKQDFKQKKGYHGQQLEQKYWQLRALVGKVVSSFSRDKGRVHIP